MKLLQIRGKTKMIEYSVGGVLRPITEQHEHLLEDARDEMQSWHNFLFAIDGRDGSGKSTLARFLAWQMGMPAIETDLFAVPGQQWPIIYRDDDLRRLIKVRLDNDLPVIVEGIFLLQVLKRIGFEPNYLVYAKNQSYEGSNIWQENFTNYDQEYTPREKAGFVFSWSED